MSGAHHIPDMANRESRMILPSRGGKAINRARHYTLSNAPTGSCRALAEWTHVADSLHVRSGREPSLWLAMLPEAGRNVGLACGLANGGRSRPCMWLRSASQLRKRLRAQCREKLHFMILLTVAER